MQSGLKLDLASCEYNFVISYQVFEEPVLTDQFDQQDVLTEQVI